MKNSENAIIQGTSNKNLLLEQQYKLHGQLSANTIPPLGAKLKQEQLEMYIQTHTENFEEDLRVQTAKGDKKYGKLTDPLDDYNWPKMIKEELVDAFVYAEMQERRNAFIAAKLRKLMNYREAPGTLEEINYWLDQLEVN